MKTMMRMGMMVALMLAAGGMSASAQMTTNIWRLTGDGDWAVDANWTNSGSANHQPTASEWVVIGDNADLISSSKYRKINSHRIRSTQNNGRCKFSIVQKGCCINATQRNAE